MDPTIVVAAISGLSGLLLFLLTNRFSDRRAEKASKIAEGVEEEKKRVALAEADRRRQAALAQMDREYRDEARKVLGQANKDAAATMASAQARRDKAQAESDAYATELRRAKDEEIANLRAQVAALQKSRDVTP